MCYPQLPSLQFELLTKNRILFNYPKLYFWNFKFLTIIFFNAKSSNKYRKKLKTKQFIDTTTILQNIKRSSWRLVIFIFKMKFLRRKRNNYYKLFNYLKNKWNFMGFIFWKYVKYHFQHFRNKISIGVSVDIADS